MSEVITRLAKKGILPERSLKGKWESFVIKTIDHPAKGMERALVVAGSLVGYSVAIQWSFL